MLKPNNKYVRCLCVLCNSILALDCQVHQQGHQKGFMLLTFWCKKKCQTVRHRFNDPADGPESPVLFVWFQSKFTNAPNMFGFCPVRTRIHECTGHLCCLVQPKKKFCLVLSGALFSFPKAKKKKFCTAHVKKHRTVQSIGRVVKFISVDNKMLDGLA